MTFTQSVLTILVVVLGTMTTRFLPFILFPDNKKPPAFIVYLGEVLPYAVMGLLVVFSIKDGVFSEFYCLPESLAIAFICILHLWRKSMFLSIAGGTVFYMILVQTIFA